MENLDIRRELLQRLRTVNPLDFFDLLFYVAGVVLLIYALMRLVRGFEAKDRSIQRSGFRILALSLLFILQRLLLRRFELL